MPKEYIEREAILDAIAEGYGKRNDTQEGTAIEIWGEIKKIPAADVVEVVRCKDCKHWQYMIGEKIEYYECRIFCGAYERGYRTVANDFCSYGERKDEGK